MINKTLSDTISGYRKMFRIAFQPRQTINSMQNSKKILMLAWKFPPHISGGVYRPAAFARYAMDYGWKVTVACEAPPTDISQSGDYLRAYVGDHVKYIHINPSSLTPSFKFFPRIDGGSINALETVETIIGYTRKTKPSIIVASGPPFHNFLVAYLLYRIFNIPYILDYRDEWSENPFPFVEKGRLNKFAEKLCLKHATKVIFTTESQRQHQLNTFHILDAHKALVVENGWEPKDFDTAPESQHQPYTDKFVITFAGALSDHTLPQKLLEQVEKVLDQNINIKNFLQIQFIGSKSPRALKQLREFRYPEVIMQIDQLPKKQAIHAMKKSNLLLLINSQPFERYIPGKLYDYLATGVPILVFGEKGEIENIIKMLSAGHIVPDNTPTKLEEVLLKCKNNKYKREVSPIVQKWLDERTRKKSALQLVKLIEENSSFTT